MKTVLTASSMMLLSLCTSAATYYISASGSDTNDGLSPATAWNTIAKVDSITFIAGDQILFEGGSTFTGSLYFDVNDQGTPADPIIVSSYGTGKATISSDVEVGIYGYNTAGFKIQNLIVTGSGPKTNLSSGILFYMDSLTAAPRLKYITVDNVEVSGYSSNGICVGSYNGSNGFDDVTITNCTAYNIGFVGIGSYGLLRLCHKNIYIANNVVYNVTGNGDTTVHSGSGILVSGFDGGIVEHCEAYNNGATNQAIVGGPIGIWVYQSNNIVLQYNESHHNKTNTSKDGGGFDLDGGVTNSVVQYNYSHDNAGAGYLLCQNRTFYQWNNNVVRYNKSVNDGLKNSYAAIHLYSNNNYGGINNLDIYQNDIISPFARGVFIQSIGVYNTRIRQNNFTITDGKYTAFAAAENKTLSFEKNNYGSGASFKVQWVKKNYLSLKAWRDACGQEKFILREIWYNVSGTAVTTIPVTTPPSEVQYLDSYETPQNLADNYGERISGFVSPQQTGSYVFWIAGDDDTKLSLSTDSTTKNKVKIAASKGSTGYRYFTKTAGQKSALISLVAGKKYYVEVLHKESVNNDYVTLKWTLPDKTEELPIPSGYASYSAKFAAANNLIVKQNSFDLLNENDRKLFAFPNPFNSITTIQYNSVTAFKASVDVYDMQGKRVQNVFTGMLQKGLNTFKLQPANLKHGLYVVRLAGNALNTSLHVLYVE